MTIILNDALKMKKKTFIKIQLENKYNNNRMYSNEMIIF